MTTSFPKNQIGLLILKKYTQVLKLNHSSDQSKRKTASSFTKATCSVETAHPCVLCPTALGGPLSAVDSWVADIALSSIKCPVHRIPLSFFGSEFLFYLGRRHILTVPLPSFSWPREKLDTSSLVSKITYNSFPVSPRRFSANMAARDCLVAGKEFSLNFYKDKAEIYFDLSPTWS